MSNSSLDRLFLAKLAGCGAGPGSHRGFGVYIVIFSCGGWFLLSLAVRGGGSPQSDMQEMQKACAAAPAESPQAGHDGRAGRALAGLALPLGHRSHRSHCHLVCKPRTKRCMK